MGEIVIAGLAPHPPIMISEVGKKEADRVINTRLAMEQLALRFKQADPDLLLVISPHGPVFQDGIAINFLPGLKGNLARFGAAEVKISLSNDLEFCSELARTAGQYKVDTILLDQQQAARYGIELELDHGTLVPLHFLEPILEDLPLVQVSIGLLSREQLYAFGLAIQQTAEALGRNLAVLASGDLSHRLTEFAPSGYHPRGKEFDLWLTGLIKNNQLEKILTAEEDLCQQAGECGFIPLTILTGSLDGLDYTSDLLSYEGPFGVGYAVASFQIEGKNPERQIYNQLLEANKQKLARIRDGESAYVRLARESLESYVITGKRLKLESKLSEEFQKRAGVFVSLKKGGQLRGCIGTVESTKPNLAEEIISNSISAGTGDPRFLAVQKDELPELVYSVDVLFPPEQVQSEDELDPLNYGVIVEKGGRRGLLLPNLSGVDTVEEQLRIAKQKAGIRSDEKAKIYRFKVKRYN